MIGGVIYQDVYMGEGEIVLRTGLVKISEVGTYLYLPVFLKNWNHV
jgi:hypothetical protein